MSKASFRFYEELNDFLPPSRRKQEFEIEFKSRNSIKDMVEAIGVPHTEVDLILVNGESVNFNYIVQPDDRISVYPMFESLDISPVNRLRPRPLRQPYFVLDTHLGKLARNLRLLGFDCLYSNTYTDQELADISSKGHKRILLTRDCGLLKRSQVTHGYFVREIEPLKQTKEILRRFDLYQVSKPFSRCIRCNGELKAVTKDKIQGQIPERIAARHEEFVQCIDCERVYWKGSHYQRLKLIAETMLDGR